jgi:hypothetical protein
MEVDRQTGVAWRLEPLFFYLLVLLQTVPVWAVKYFPSQDGVAHVENASILRHLFGPTGDFYRRYYRLNPFPEPNWTGHVLLMGLTAVLSPANALKAIVIVFVVAFPQAVRYAAAGIRPGGAWVAWLSLPFVFALPLLKGNFNFCLGVLLFFIVIGYWVRCRSRMNAGAAVVLGGLLLLLYFSHVVPLVMAVLTICAIELAHRLDRGRSGDGANRMPITPGIIACAPAVILAAAFFIWHRSSTVERLPADVLLQQLVRFSALVGDERGQVFLAMVVAALFGVETIYILWRLSRDGRCVWDVLGVLAVVAIGIYFIVPNSAAGGGQISLRLGLFPYFLILLWLASRPFPRVLGTGGIALAALIAFSLGGTQHRSAKQIDAYMDDFTSIASHISRGSTLLPVMASTDDYLPDGRRFTHKLRPFLSAAGYVTTQREGIDLSNYEAGENYFPLIWRKSPLGGAALADYIVVWQTGGVDADSPLNQVRPILAVSYRRVYISPHGWATLYQRNAIGAR